VETLLRELKCEEAQLKRVTRLGKRPLPGQDGQPAKPRPVQIVLDSEEQQKLVLGNAKNLKDMKEGGWNKVYINRDLTPVERRQRQQTIKELVQRKNSGEKDLMIWRGQIVKRRY
jgi:hypothetical protein